MHLSTLICASMLVLTLASRVAAQHEEHAGPPPVGVDGLGKVNFPTSCSLVAQGRFNRAIALQHSFWYEEAGRAFKEVSATDSTCAMAYWGYAMSLLHPLWTPPGEADLKAGLAASEQAVTFSRPGTRERAYADAIVSYYRDYATVSHAKRLLAYESGMAAVVRSNPDDQEARIFYALALVANASPSDTTFARQQKAGAILEPLFQTDPQHPGLAHYVIHAYDSPRYAAKAVTAADRYATIAPSVPHARHMPSHIYTRLGLWDQDIASNLSSRDAARAYEQQQLKGNTLWDQDGHAMDYLAYAYLQEGRDREARQLVDEAARVTAVFPLNSLTNDYALAAIPARYALERGAWPEAAKLTVRPAPSWRAAEGITHFARAIGAARSGDTVTARAEVATLEELEPALAKLAGPQAYWSTQVKIQRLAASAWIAKARSDPSTALKLAAEAADLEDVTEKHPVTPGAVAPARELQGDILLELKRPTDALRAYEATLARSPNRARSLWGAMSAAASAGNQVAAKSYAEKYLALMVKSEGNRAEVGRAKAILNGQ